jgi:subfamily B ATP-binding cassette protein HlyB/CyaB
MTISILYLGVQAVLRGELSIGQLIAFQMFASARSTAPAGLSWQC